MTRLRSDEYDSATFCDQPTVRRPNAYACAYVRPINRRATLYRAFAYVAWVFCEG